METEGAKFIVSTKTTEKQRRANYNQTLVQLDDMLTRTVTGLREAERDVELYQQLFFEVLDHNFELKSKVATLEKKLDNTK